MRSAGGFSAGLFFLVAMVGIVSAGDFGSYSVGKGIYYDQTMGGDPVLKLPFPYRFHARVAPIKSGLTASVKGPASAFWSSLNRYLSFSVDPALETWEREATQAELDTAFPDGDYAFDIFSFQTGHQFVTNTLAAGVFPNAPTITNLVAAQSVAADNDFTLGWNPFDGGDSADFIYFQLFGSAYFRTPGPGTAGALDGTATSLVIPAGTLPAGHAFLGRLVFAKTLTITTNPQSDAVGFAFSFSQTDFWLRTAGGDNVPPAIAWTSPTNGATGVPSNLPIGVHFTKPMGPYYSIDEQSVSLGSSANGGSRLNFSPDGLEAVLTPVRGYTSHALHIITFNSLQSGSLGFSDTNGNPLAAETVVVSFIDGDFLRTPGRPRLTNPHRQTNGTFEVELQAEPDFSYVLESSTGLSGWSSLATNIAFGGTARFVDTNAIPPGAARFYRGRVQ